MDQRLDKGYQLDSLRMATRLRLDELTYVEHPDSLEVERLLDQSAQSERELAALAYRTGRGIFEIQPPEKRRQTERAYRKLMGLKDADTSSAGPTTRDSISGTRGTTHRKGG